MNGVLLDQEEELLSPKEAVQCFDCGESIDEILANLDVDACHFTKRVDDEGEEPVITTGFPCYTAPSRGVLVFSIDEMKRQQALGKDVILIVDHMAFLHNLHVERGALDQPEGLIVLFPEEQGVWEGLYEHFLANLLYYSSVLLDNPTKPQITMLEGQKKIKMGNDELSEGDLVTIDPVSGKLWRGELPSLLPDEDVQILAKLLKDLGLPADPAQVAIHAQQKSDFEKTYDIEVELDAVLSTGLYRTDMNCFKWLRNEDKSAFTYLSQGAVPFSLDNWRDYGFSQRVNYRLPDLHNLRDVLPDEFREALKNGDDHKIGTPLFKLRETLYWHLLETNFLNLRDKGDCAGICIIIPSVTNAEEVKHFKKMVEEITPPELKGQIKFGVMIETKEALDNIEEIAPLCDCLCVGTNGLTESLIPECPRGELDHSCWMKERGYDGVSPYDVLVPEVTKPLAEALARARRANPDVFINMCGHQTGGHHMGSIKSALGMDVDQLTVPPNEENYHRTQLAIAQHEARRKLSCTPTPEVQDDLELLL